MSPKFLFLKKYSTNLIAVATTPYPVGNDEGIMGPPRLAGKQVTIDKSNPRFAQTSHIDSQLGPDITSGEMLSGYMIFLVEKESIIPFSLAVFSLYSFKNFIPLGIINVPRAIIASSDNPSIFRPSLSRISHSPFFPPCRAGMSGKIITALRIIAKAKSRVDFNKADSRFPISGPAR